MAVYSIVRVRPPAAVPVVGWPPVRSFRRNLASSSSRQSPPSSSAHHQDARVKGAAAAGKGATAGEGGHKGGLFVKINMDGVPIGRKVDLRAYGGYAELSAAVGKLFRGLLAGTFSIAPRLFQELCVRLLHVLQCSSCDHAKNKKSVDSQLRGTRRGAGAAARRWRRARSR